MQTTTERKPFLSAPLDQDPELRVGSLQVRLAQTPAEVAAAQVLRYRVFFEEMQAHPSPEVEAERRDFDALDVLCDHLLVIDHNRGPGPEQVVGTYRLIRRQTAALHGRFYSSDEFDITPLIDYPGEILELGRSCVDIDYRNRPTMQLLWKGIAAYLAFHEIVLMFGCASLPGTDPLALRLPLSYLYHHHLAPPALRARAQPHRYVDMRLVEQHDIDLRKAVASLPPLLKGYLRLGAFIGDGAVIDADFNTTDVCIILKTDLVADKYMKHYERRGQSLAQV